MIRRLLPAVALLLALATGALLLLPARIDWDRYRPALAEHAGERLGRRIAINGALRLRFLPETVLEADGIEVGLSGDEVELTAAALRLRLDPWHLLLGRISVREVTLVGADIRLPWPPSRLPTLRPLGSLTALDARLEDSRVSISGVTVEGVSARLLAGGPTDALSAEGRFAWRGQPVAFSATLGRAGDDGVAPFDLSTQLGAARLSTRGVLLAEGGYEGRLEASGPDLSALLPTPPGAFTAQARLTATAELLAADQLQLVLAGQQARGGISLRYAPTLRLDASLLASSYELDAWEQAFRRGGGTALPVSIDLSAESATLRGVRLRQLRVGVQLEQGRILVPDGRAELPGDMKIAISGAGTADASEWRISLDGPRAEALNPLLPALGIAIPGLSLPEAPLRGTLRLSLDARQAALNEMALTLDGQPVRGGATWRWGARPFLGAGLELGRLEVERWAGGLAALPALDLELRLSAATARWAGREFENLSIDGSATAGRVLLRRLRARHAGAEITAAANLTLSPFRVQEATLELEGGQLAALLGTAPASLPLGSAPVRLRASVSGPVEQLALRAEAEVEDARAEAQATLDARESRAQGTMTLRHPGAARFLAPWLTPAMAEWINGGSFALIANLGLRGGNVSAESIDIVAGQQRARGALGLNLAGDRPRLTGQLAAETLRLPERTSLPDISALRLLDAELAWRAERLEIGALPAIAEARGGLRLDAGRLALELAEGQLQGGALRGLLEVDPSEGLPRLNLTLNLEGFALSSPLPPTPPHVLAGTADMALRLSARGAALPAWRSSLQGEGQVSLRDGVAGGFDMAALAAGLALPETLAAQRAIQAALAGGTTPFQRLLLPFTVQAGQFSLRGASIAAEAGEARLSGGFDLPRGVGELRVTIPPPEGPEIGLWFNGRPGAMQRLAETARYLRWRIEREQ